ncbi:MAG: DUF3822 family protein [Dysgonamonadaceae bacterium]|jgi:hypothetical protein|nr:DUF3822 family protein [Dysgonamonadaceae bacterium]
MEIQLPHPIDVNRANRYILTIEVHPVRFAFTLFDTENPENTFEYSIPGNDLHSAFSQFQNAYFDNVFFAFPYKKIRIINCLPVFTFVPRLLFDAKDKEKYMQYLFVSASGRILTQTLSHPDLVILHELPKEISGFFQRTFVDAQFSHFTACLLEHYQQTSAFQNGKRIFVQKQSNSLYITCFSRGNLLLCNHFDCRKTDDASYYVLYLWKQLNFDQRQDFLFISDENQDLTGKIKPYIAHISSSQPVSPCAL